MLDVIVFDLIAPTVVEVVDFASNFAAQLNVKRFVNFAKTTFTENAKDEVPFTQNSKSFSATDSTVFALFLIPHSFVLK
jgi:hypothetical protein